MERTNYVNRIIFALLLIAIGSVLLLTNFGLMGGGIWTNLLQLWPILLIALGLSSLIGGREIFGPTISITLGASILLANFDVLTAETWGILFGLWPVLLIAGGLDLVNRRRSIWVALLSTAALIGFVFAMFWVNGAFAANPGVGETSENIRIPYTDISRAEISLSPSAGTFQVNGMDEAGVLVVGSVPEASGEPVGITSYRESGDSGYFSYQEGQVNLSTAFGSGTQRSVFSIFKELPTELAINLGVGFSELDLTGMQLETLNISSGLGTIEILLPAEGSFQGKIEGGIGQITILAPANLALRVVTEKGIAVVNGPAEYNVTNGIYTSPAYERGEEAVELDLNQAIGLITIQVVH
jgi:LiaF transmembrane domain